MGLTQSMLSWPMVLPTPSFSGDGAAALMNRQPCEAVYASLSPSEAVPFWTVRVLNVGVEVSLYDQGCCC